MNQLFSPAVLIHMLAAFAAMGLGAAVFLRRKGTGTHAWMGRTWVALMLVVTFSTIWIKGHGHYSWIHLLSVATTLMLALGVYAAIQGRIRAHRKTMTAVYVGGLVIAGAFTFLPQRVLGKMLWGALGLV
jgi:uncharacterized membrane protein